MFFGLSNVLWSCNFCEDKMVPLIFFTPSSFKSISIVFSFVASILTNDIWILPFLSFDAEADIAGKDFPPKVYRGECNSIGNN